MKHYLTVSAVILGLMAVPSYVKAEEGAMQMDQTKQAMPMGQAAGSMQMDDQANDTMVDDSAMQGQAPAAATTEAAVEVGNKTCPISGKKTGEMGKIVQQEYNGKIYNLCCPMCIKDFQKDPEKYSKMVEETMAKEQAAMGNTRETSHVR